MTLQELKERLDTIAVDLHRIAPDDPQRFELEDLRSILKIELTAGSFDVTKELSEVTAVYTKRLMELSSELKTVTSDEEMRSYLLGRIIRVAQFAIRAAGVPVPTFESLPSHKIGR